jgi:thioesterase domain-containing protein
VGGEHNSMLYPPHVREIAAHVERLCKAMTTANL